MAADGSRSPTVGGAAETLKEVPRIEARSFDYVPLDERHGTLWTQSQLWFMVNAAFLTASTGALGVLGGLGLAWSITAIVLGSVFGTLFVAFHGAQGPRLGLPQMIQSRVQFGTKGVVVPLIAAVLVQFGFAIFYIQTGAQSVQSVVHGPLHMWELLVGGAAIAIATIGYFLVLRFEKLLSYLAVGVLVLLTICALSLLDLGTYLQTNHFSWTPFLVQFAASATFQVAIAPTVSDYTRYLPEWISGNKVSAAVFGGSVLSAIWIEVLGAVLIMAYPKQSTIGGFAALADKVSPAFKDLVMLVSLFTCLASVSVSFYCGSVAFLTAVEGFKKIRSTALLRGVTLTGLGLASVAATLFMSDNLLGNFAVFLTILAYFLIPWTAVNLLDYYVIRRGVMSVTDILSPDGGIYGWWGWRGMTSYLVAFLAMIPFFSTSVWQGPAAKAMGGADFSFAVGLLVSGGVYFILTRTLDVAHEARVVAQAPINTIRATRAAVTGDAVTGAAVTGDAIPELG